MYRLLADLVLIIHAVFVAFVIFGGVLALWKPRIAPWHLLALAWGALVIAMGWVCPLTPLENQLRESAGIAGYSGGFVEQYVTRILYPPGLTRNVQIALAVALIVGNAVIYGVWIVRWRRRRK